MTGSRSMSALGLLVLALAGCQVTVGPTTNKGAGGSSGLPGGGQNPPGGQGGNGGSGAAGTVGGSSGSSAEGDAERREALDAFASGKKLELAPEEAKHEVQCDECPAKPQQEGNFLCSYVKYREAGNFADIATFAPNSSELWLGSVLRGDDAAQGALTPLGAELAPVTFSLSLSNLKGSPKGSMDEPSLSSYREALKGVLDSGVEGETSALVSISYEQIFSEQQMQFALKAAGGFGPFKASAGFDFSTQTARTRLAVDFRQTYYTADVDAPARPADFFGPSVTASQLEGILGDKAPPLYIKSISYGRRAVFMIETSRTFEEIKTAVSASYKGIASGVDVDFEYQQMLSEEGTTMKVFIVGGSGSDAVQAVDGYDGFVDYIKKGGSYGPDSPGAPIAYKLAYLDNAIAQVGLATEYVERKCDQNKATLQAQFLGVTDPSTDSDEPYFAYDGTVRLYYPSGSYDGHCPSVLDILQKKDKDLPRLSFFESQTVPTNPAKEFREVDGVPLASGLSLCLYADLEELDDITYDDYLGAEVKELHFEDGWPGTYSLPLVNDGEKGTVRMAVKLK